MVGTEKVEYPQSFFICSGKCPFDLCVPFIFQPVKSKVLVKWKVPLVVLRFRLQYNIDKLLISSPETIDDQKRGFKSTGPP